MLHPRHERKSKRWHKPLAVASLGLDILLLWVFLTVGTWWAIPVWLLVCGPFIIVALAALTDRL